jgi:amino acid transporter
MLHRLQGRELPRARYTLKWGLFINAAALIFLFPILAFSFFPLTTNPTPATMNWAIVMVGGPIVLATVYYIILGRKSYTPPHETVEDYIVRYEQESDTSSRVDDEKAPDAMVTGKVVDAAEKRLD